MHAFTTARKFQLLPALGKKPPPAAAPAPGANVQAPSPPKETRGSNETNATNGHQPPGPEAPPPSQLFQVSPPPRVLRALSIKTDAVAIACTQDKAQYFPQDPTAQPFPPYSTDPKVTASVQVPLKVEVERRKRLFSNQDIMYSPPPHNIPTGK